MVKYRNVKTGRILERPSQDEWLEASAGWARIDEPEPVASADEQDEGSKD